MKYQAIKHNKTGARVLGVYEDIEQAKRAIIAATKERGHYVGNSYIGGFPMYEGHDGKRYSIQGRDDHFGIVVSLPDNEDFNLY